MQKNFYPMAIALAASYHQGQTRRGGAPYITHPLAVASNFTDNKLRIVAVLHDVLEDTDIALEILEKHFTEDIVSALKLLNRKSSKSYEEYLFGINSNELARSVKIADILHNLSDKPKSQKIGEYLDSLSYLYRKGDADYLKELPKELLARKDENEG